MSGTIIKIKYSANTAVPPDTDLAVGELAYSFKTGGSGDRLYIGDNVSGAGQKNRLIGGEYFTDLLKHTLGTLTPETAILVDTNSKINELLISKIQIAPGTDTNTIKTESNIDLVLHPAGTGKVDIKTGLVVQGTTVIPSLNISGLTATRLTFAGTSGLLEDSANLTFVKASGLLSLTGSLDVDNILIDGNTISATNSNGDIIITPAGTGDVKISSIETLILPQGTGQGAQRPNAVSALRGAVRFNISTHTFEGVHSTPGGTYVWKGIGGVSDIDQDTYITAETDMATTPQTVNNTIRFFVSDVKEMQVNAGGVTVTDQITSPIANITSTANIGTANVTTKLNVTTADVTFTNGIDVTGGDVDITADLHVDGHTFLGNATTDHTVISGNLTVAGTTTTIESVTTTVTDPVMELASDSTTTAAVNDRGINFKYGDGTAIQTGFFGMDMTTKRFSFQKVLGTGDTTPDDNKFSLPWGDAQFQDLYLDGDSVITGLSTIGGTLGVTGIGTFGNNITVAGTTLSTGDFTVGASKFVVTAVTGNTAIAGTLGVTGVGTFTSNVTVGGTLGVTGVSTLTGLLNANGGIAVAANKFTVATSGNIVSAGTMNVVGAVDFDAALNVDGAVTNKSTTHLGANAEMKITAAGVMTHGTIDGTGVTIDCGTF